MHVDKTFSRFTISSLTEPPAKIAAIRDRWKGKLVVKGVVHEGDAEKAIELGVDGLIVSNHGGRQIDAGQSTSKPLAELAKKFGGRTTLMIDSGLRAGPDVACAIASGAKFTSWAVPSCTAPERLERRGAITP